MKIGIQFGVSMVMAMPMVTRIIEDPRMTRLPQRMGALVVHLVIQMVLLFHLLVMSLLAADEKKICGGYGT